METARTLTIRHFPDDVHKAAKLAAIEQGITLNQWLIDAIRTVVRQSHIKAEMKEYLKDNQD